MELKEYILASRKKIPLTQQQVADELGISLRQYGKWENGKVVPSIEKLSILESVLKCELLNKIANKELIVPHGTYEEENEQTTQNEAPIVPIYKDNLKSKGIEISLESTARVIKKVRQILDISQYTLAERIGISKDLLLKVEKGYRNVSMLTWVLTYHYLNNMPKDDFDKIKHIFEDENIMKGTGVDEDEDDEDYRKSKVPLTEYQIEFYESMLQHQKVLLEQKDSFIKLLQENQKK